MNPNCFLFFSSSFQNRIIMMLTLGLCGSLVILILILIVSCLQVCSVVPSIEISCSLLCPLEASLKKIPSLVKSYTLVLVIFLFTVCQKKKKEFLLVHIFLFFLQSIQNVNKIFNLVHLISDFMSTLGDILEIFQDLYE